MRRVVSLIDFGDPEVVTITYLFCNDNSSSHRQRHKRVDTASMFCVVTIYKRLSPRRA